MPDYSLPYLNGQIPASYPASSPLPTYAPMAGTVPGAVSGYTPAPQQSATNPTAGILGATAGLGSLFGLVNGVGQLLHSKRMHPVRPQYEIPEETQQMLGLRQNLLNAQMPGQQQATQDIYTNQANSVAGAARGASDQAQFLGLLGAAQAQTNGALNGLQTKEAQNYYNNVAGLEGAQQVMAQAKDKEWELNKYDPYLMQLQQKYQLQNAGNQNIASGITGLTSLSAALGGSGSGGSGGSGGGGGISALLPLIAGA